MNKHQLRNIYKEKRNQLSSKEKMKMDDLLLLQLQKTDVSNIQTLFTYWPMPQMNEPNTIPFTNYLRHMIPGLQIAYPVMNMNEATMQAILINEETIYHTNAFGINEPDGTAEMHPKNIDLVFVPLLAFDVYGNRVGYGKGFYDKYLMNCTDGIIKIGFSYFNAEESIDDANEYDVPLTFCITPDHIYEF
jgi:5-formyltetrahydrofolate cyclo-ligase